MARRGRLEIGHGAPVTGYDYPAGGSETIKTDPNGSQWTTVKDGLGRVVETTVPTGTPQNPGSYQATTTYTLANREAVTATDGGLDPSGAATAIKETSIQDLLGRVVSDQVGALGPTTSAYDGFGDLLQQTKAGVETTYQFNPFGQVTTTTCVGCYLDPGSGNHVDAVTQSGYDDAGRLTSVTDARNHTWSYQYANGDDNITQASLPGGLGTTNVTYDSIGEMLSITDGAGNERDFTYNAQGLQATSANADSGGGTAATQSSFDWNGNLQTVTYPQSTGSLTYTYDNLNRLVERSGTVNGVSSTEQYAYDSNGNMTLATSVTNAQAVAIAYDEANRACAVVEGAGVTQSSATCGMGSGAGVSTYAYQSSQVDQVTDAAGTTTYRYAPSSGSDPTASSGLLVQETPALGTGQLDFAYTAQGRLAGRSDPTGMTTCLAYDPSSGRLVSESVAVQSCSSPSPSPLASFGLTYDPVGNVSSQTQQVSGFQAADTGTWTYGYDQANRLTQATSPGGTTTSYQYDAAGNMCWTATGSSSNACSNPPSGATTLGYDRAGYLASATAGSTTVTYTTNPLGELAASQVGSGNPTTYAYDPWGRMVSYSPSSGSGASMAWDALGREISETVGSTTATLGYLGTSFNLASESAGSATTLLDYSPQGPLAQRQGSGSAQYFVADPHGDVVSLVDASTGSQVSGAVAAYTPFGGVGSGYSTGWSVLGFQGDPTDPVTGLVNMEHRLYAPSLARFVTQDSVFGSMSDPTSLNQFVYGQDNPVTMTDPTGNMPIGPGQTPCHCSFRAIGPVTFFYDPTDIAQLALSLPATVRVTIFKSFFRKYPGAFSALSGSATQYGYGGAAITFAQWLMDSGRLGALKSNLIPSDPGIRWWRLTDGALALDIRAANLALSEGYTTSDNPAVQAWINYGLGNVSGGFNEQGAFWFAHQLSIHSLMGTQEARNDLAATAKETITEASFMQAVVKNVDWAALNNVPTNSSELGTLTRGVYPSVYPIASGRMLLIDYFDLGNGIPNVGIFSTRWNE